MTKQNNSDTKPQKETENKLGKKKVTNLYDKYNKSNDCNFISLKKKSNEE